MLKHSRKGSKTASQDKFATYYFTERYRLTRNKARNGRAEDELYAIHPIEKSAGTLWGSLPVQILQASYPRYIK